MTNSHKLAATWSGDKLVDEFDIRFVSGTGGEPWRQALARLFLAMPPTMLRAKQIDSGEASLLGARYKCRPILPLWADQSAQRSGMLECRIRHG